MFRVSPAYLRKSLSIQEINSLSKESFYYFFQNVVLTNCDLFHNLWATLPTTGQTQLIDTFLQEIDNLNEYDKLIMLHKYNDMMTSHLSSLKPKCKISIKHLEEVIYNEELYKSLNNLIKKYKEKFSFPFIYYPSDQNLYSVCKEVEQRCDNLEDIEINHALKIVKKIAVDELQKRII